MKDHIIASALARDRTKFLEELPKSLHELQALRRQVELGVSLKDASGEIGLIAHRLSGTAATLGFQDLGAAASGLEALTTRRTSPDILPDDLLPHLDRLLGLMQTALDPHDHARLASSQKAG